MYSRDYILNEARKMAAILAKLLGYKVEGDNDGFEEEMTSALRLEFNTDLRALISFNTEEFTRHLLAANYSAEKLNALSGILYLKAQPFQPDADTRAILGKTLLIFDLLERQHHYQTFENIGRRTEIEAFLGRK